MGTKKEEASDYPTGRAVAEPPSHRHSVQGLEGTGWYRSYGFLPLPLERAMNWYFLYKKGIWSEAE